MGNNAFGFPRDLFLGFDSLFDQINNASQQSYPPYNVVKKGTDQYLIEIAVAGFKREDITITTDKGNLIVEGSIKDDDGSENDNYLHRGISTRKFRREFTLADTIELAGADLVDGMLVIGLINKVPEEEKPQTIALGTLNQELLLG